MKWLSDVYYSEDFTIYFLVYRFIRVNVLTYNILSINKQKWKIFIIISKCFELLLRNVYDNNIQLFGNVRQLDCRIRARS